jgi:hypothetical protein
MSLFGTILNTLIGLEGLKQPKVPTIIQYDAKDPTKFTWGAQKHGPNAIEGIKLLLDPDQTRPHYLPESNALDELAALGKSAVQIAGDFIRAIYNHAIEQIESSIPSAYMDLCSKEFVLSVPAVWSDKAKDLTLQVLITFFLRSRTFELTCFAGS